MKALIVNEEAGINISSENASLVGSKLSLRGKDFPVTAHKTRVDVVTYFEDGLRFMWGEISLSLPEQVNVDIMSDPGKRQERRRNLKVRTSFDAKVLSVESLGKKRRRMRVDEGIRLRDLSLGGAGFFSNHVFFRNQKIVLDLSYLKPGFVTVFQVLRRERTQEHPESGARGFRFRYGGRVLKLTGEEERTVCEYVFKVQLTEHHRRKNRLG
jgi:hypothetical protein